MGVCMGSIDECGSRDKNRANAPELLGTADVFIYNSLLVCRKDV